DGPGHLQPGAVGIVLDDDPAVAGVLEAQRVVDDAGTGVVGPDVQGDGVGAVLLRPLEDRLGEQERDALLAGPGGDPHGLQITLVIGGVRFTALRVYTDGLRVHSALEPGASA